jgi:hypothetical protein
MNTSHIPKTTLFPVYGFEGVDPSVPLMAYDEGEIAERKAQEVGQLLLDNQRWGTFMVGTLVEAIDPDVQASTAFDKISTAAAVSAIYNLAKPFKGEEPVQGRRFSLVKLFSDDTGDRLTPEQVREQAIDRFYAAGAFAGALALDHRALKPRDPESQRSYGYTVGHAALSLRAIGLSQEVVALPDSNAMAHQKRKSSKLFSEVRTVSHEVGVVPSLAGLADRDNKFTSHLLSSKQTPREIKSALRDFYDIQRALVRPAA